MSLLAACLEIHPHGHQVLGSSTATAGGRRRRGDGEGGAGVEGEVDKGLERHGMGERRLFRSHAGRLKLAASGLVFVVAGLLQKPKLATCSGINSTRFI